MSDATRNAAGRREEYWEVAVQADPGGRFFVLADPQERYPDAGQAAEEALKVQDHFHCARVRRVTTDWYVPELIARGGATMTGLTLETILVAVAIGIIVPVVLLVGPYLGYLLPQRKRRMSNPEENRFAETLAAALRKEGTR